MQGILAWIVQPLKTANEEKRNHLPRPGSGSPDEASRQQSKVKRDHLHQPPGNVPPPNAAQEVAGILHLEAAVLTQSACRAQGPLCYSLQSCFPAGEPRYTLVWGLILPRCRTLLFPLLNFMRFLSDHFSSLSRFL